MKKLMALLYCSSLLVAAANDANSLEFLEAYAWGDREVALKLLVPNTEDYYYYLSLHHQLSGNRTALEESLKDWLKFLGNRGPSSRYREIALRQKLLEFGRDPDGTWKTVRDELNLLFQHRRRDEVRQSTAPSRVDPDAYSVSAFRREAHRRSGFPQYSERGLALFAVDGISGENRRVLLSKISRPDFPGLVSLIAVDLDFKDSRGFGSLPIHNLLTRSQLEELERLRPALLRDEAYVVQRLARIPAPVTDLARDHETAVAHFERVWGFVRKLEPMHNSLKASVLYQLLDHQRHLGRYDESLFQAYLELPRRVPYLPRERALRMQRTQTEWVNFNYQPGHNIVLTPIGEEQPLVRDFLIHLLRDATTPKAYETWFESAWLNAIFAESKILHGIGMPDAQAARLTPGQYRALLDRIELDFALQNPVHIKPGAEVQLSVDVKRVDSVLVKIYELQTFNYYTSRRAPVDQAVELDGLVATHERTIPTAAAPGRRVRHTLAFPEIKERGVYVVELIGGGVSSRAVLHVGSLETISQPAAAGQAVMVLNDAGEHCRHASLWIDGREFSANEHGLILLPYSEEPGVRFAVLRDGDFCSPEQFNHLGEVYRFSAGIHLDPQNLPRRKTGLLILRPDLRINGLPLDPARLGEVTVALASVDAADTRTEREFKAVFVRDQEWTGDFFVPDDVRRFEVSVSAKIRRRSDGEDIVLNDDYTLVVNGARAGNALSQVFLQPASGGWMLEVRGLSGEPIAGVPLQLTFFHPAFDVNTRASVTTDDAGRVELGALADLSRIQVSGPGNVSLDQILLSGDAVFPDRLHVSAGDSVSLAYPYADPHGLTPATLLRMERGAVQAILNDHIRIAAGELQINGLNSGQYELILHQAGERLTLEVADGDARHGYIFAERRRLQETTARMPSVGALTWNGAAVRLDLRHVTPSTRVAVRAARYAGPGGAMASGFGFTSPLHRYVHPAFARYISGRNIGDEYRYVLDRRYQEIFAGTLLDRPGLILNPWELRETTAERERLKAGEAYLGGRQRIAAAAAASRSERLYRLRAQEELAESRDIGFDFLPQGSLWWLNLLPDENGQVELDMTAMGEQTHLEVLVLDRFGTSRYRVALPDRDFVPRDVRLTAGLNPALSFSRQKTIRALAEDETVLFPELATTRYQVIRTLGQAYDLLRTLGGQPELDDFAFLKHWPALDDETKLRKYGEFACHELHLFLYVRDRAFFDAVIEPYLSNKKDKTFIDRWLLDALTPEDTRLDNLQERNAIELALLARRGGDATVIRAALREQWELIPDDPDAFSRRVRVALQSADLDETVAQSRQEMRDKAETDSLDLARERRKAPAVAFGGIMASRSVGAASSRPAPAPAMGLREMTLEEDSDGMALDDAMEGDAFAIAEMEFDELEELFKALPKTKEWAEQNYYRLRQREDTAERVGVNAFWRDVAALTPVSAHLLEAHTSFSEALIALAFCGLPWDADEPRETLDGATLSLTSAGPALLVSEQIRAAEDADDDRPLLISQQYFRQDDRYRHEGNEQIEKFVTGEFVRRTVYGARVTLTNPTASRRRLNVLMQIPQGSIPVNNGFYTDDQSVLLDPYTTRTIEFFFYFPFAGEFEQFPAHAAGDEAIIGRAEPRVFRVVDAPTEIDRTSWTWVSQYAENEEVLAFLEMHNLRRLDLDEMAWRLRDRDFFVRAADLLAARLHFDGTTFSYAIYHKDVERSRVWLSRGSLAGRVGPVFDSELLSIDPVTRKTYEHLEYDPLVNPRVHPAGQFRKILNPAVDQQYRAFLRDAVYRASLNESERLALVYYLLLQDRLSEARDQLTLLSDAAVHERLQRDYLRAWLALRTLDLDRAVALAEPYLAYPVPRWRARFSALHNAVVEARGDLADVAQDPDRQQRMDRAAAGAPALEMKQEGGRILVYAHNLARATLNLYPMDIELLFSRQPFLSDGGEGFGIIKPAYRREIELPGDGTEFELELPSAFRDINVVAELAGRGLRESVARYANKLRVMVMQSFGQIEVRSSETGEPLPRTYIKVYARGVDGRESFWKDGYTDLRGRFDYLSLNDRKPEEAVYFAILVLHPEHGAVIRETTPPTR